MDRTTKLHQHEFETLPEVWFRLGVALTASMNFSSRLQSYPDLERMESAQFAEFVDSSELQSWQKQKIKASDSRNKDYQEYIFWHRLNETMTKHAEFHNHFISKGIFIPSELKEEIRALSDMIYDAVRERQFEHEYPEVRPSQFDKRDLLAKEGINRLKKIEAAVQSRLWEASKLD